MHELPLRTKQVSEFGCLFNNHDQPTEDAIITKTNFNEMLFIQGNTVVWYKGDLVSRKLVYRSQVINAFFTKFSQAEDPTDRVLVVALVNTIYIYYKDGRSYLSSFPFQIKRASAYENGFVIEKSNSFEDVTSSQFLTINEPMMELGSIVSSSTSSISSQESLAYFPETQHNQITVTFNESDDAINFYYTKFLNRSNGASFYSSNLNPSLKRKPSIRKASINLDTNDTEMNTKPDDIIVDKKRSKSYSQVLSIDRMTSYDSISSSKKPTEPQNSSSIESTLLRKDAILTKIQTFSLHSYDQKRKLKIKSLVFEDKEAIVIQDSSNIVLDVFIFEVTSTCFPKLIKRLNLSNYLGFTTCALEGFLILLSDLKTFVLFNPFLNLSTSLFRPSKLVHWIDDTDESQIIARDQVKKIVTYDLNLIPRSQLVLKCLKSFKYLVNSYTYNYIWILWINSTSIVSDEWDSFILTILTLMIPFAINSDQVDDSNRVSQLLSKIGPLQILALKDEFSIQEMGPNIVLALHIIREELKMNILLVQSIDNLGLLLAQLTFWMGWNESWVKYYDIDSNTLNKSIKFPNFQLLESPPDLIKSLTSLFDLEIRPYCTFSRLVQETEEVDELITPRTLHVLRLFEVFVSPDSSSSDIINLMNEFKITQSNLETFPIGIVIPLKEAIASCKENLDNLQNEGLTNVDLLDRNDLKILLNKDHIDKKPNHHNLKQQTRDIHQIISSINDSHDSLTPVENDRFNITKLIFDEDRRFYEISKLLQTFQSQSVIIEELSSLSEQESLIKQKVIANLVALRTLSIPIGRSMIFFSSKLPLITERYPVPKLNFNTLIQPENVTVSLERTSIDSNALQWGYFHNGASSGLTISKDAKGISGSWIVFNKPDVLSSQHGGFLLGLGLNGHLKKLEEWNIYNYLGPKHSFTGVGLLLGMSASLRGTMDVKLTKVLSVHVVALLPHGASDLIISTPVQTAGLIGTGLLYLETQHRKMSEILLTQITGNVHVEDKEVANESYRLAAGIGLGYVNLGKGNHLRNSYIVDRLLEIGISMKDVQSDESFDKSMSGAIIALGFIYLKTDNDVIAKKLQIPDSEQLLDYIRPDIILLRVLCKNLVLWDKIGKNKHWIESQIPEKILENPSGNITNNSLNHLYIVSGLCLSMGIRFASTSDLTVRNTIMNLYDQITETLNQIESSDSYHTRLVKQSYSQSEMILAISMSLVMAATGDLEVFKRLRILQGKFNNLDESETYGKMMSANMALGFLFLGGGQYAFNCDDNFSIASLITSVYPLFPKVSNFESDVHLQALRHFWALSVEPRCLTVRDVDTLKPVKIDLKIELQNGKSKNITSPCLLPSIETINKISTEDDEFFRLRITRDDLENSNLNIYVMKRRNIKVLQKSVKVILDRINEKFDESATTDENKLLKLDVFKNFKRSDVANLLQEIPETGSQPNIIDRQIELIELVKKPKNTTDLWNLKLIFMFYDKILNDEDANYLSIEFIEELKNSLWLLHSS